MVFTPAEQRIAEIVREDLKNRFADAMFPGIRMGWPDCDDHITSEERQANFERKTAAWNLAKQIQDMFDSHICRFYWESLNNG